MSSFKNKGISSEEAVVEKKHKGSGRFKRSFTNRQFKSGAYSSFITVLVIAIVVVVNLVFGKLDLSTDLSSNSLFTLSSDTKKVLDSAKHDITIYYMVEDGQEQDYIDKVLKQYPKVSDNVKLEKIDPVVNPAFASKYVSDDVSENDVIVVNDDTDAAKYVANTDMYYSQTDYSTYESSYYLDVEGQITSAIQSVLSDTSTKMYIVSGHDEQDLGTTITDSLDKLNVETDELKLYSEDAVPDDCDILLINGPTKDISSEEKDKIIKYLKAGGDAIINVEYTTKKTPNLRKLLKYYGVNEQMGTICETTGNYYNYINCIIPTTNTSDSITSDVDGILVIPYPVALSQASSDSLRSTLTISDLLTTSEGSYLKVDPSSGDGSKASGDIDGPFDVGISVTDQIDDDNETQLVVYASAYAFADDFTSTSQLDNASLFENAVKSMSKSDVEEASIDVKSLSYSYVSLTTGTQIFWAAVIIIIIPVGLLIAGFAIWMVRRRK